MFQCAYRVTFVEPVEDDDEEDHIEVIVPVNSDMSLLEFASALPSNLDSIRAQVGLSDDSEVISIEEASDLNFAFLPSDLDGGEREGVEGSASEGATQH